MSHKLGYWTSATTKHADSYDRPHSGLELNHHVEMEHETADNSVNQCHHKPS